MEGRGALHTVGRLNSHQEEEEEERAVAAAAGQSVFVSTPRGEELRSACFSEGCVAALLPLQVPAAPRVTRARNLARGELSLSLSFLPPFRLYDSSI